MAQLSKGDATCIHVVLWSAMLCIFEQLLESASTSRFAYPFILYRGALSLPEIRARHIYTFLNFEFYGALWLEEKVSSVAHFRIRCQNIIVAHFRREKRLDNVNFWIFWGALSWKNRKFLQISGYAYPTIYFHCQRTRKYIAHAYFLTFSAWK